MCVSCSIFWQGGRVAEEALYLYVYTKASMVGTSNLGTITFCPIPKLVNILNISQANAPQTTVSFLSLWHLPFKWFLVNSMLIS